MYLGRIVEIGPTGSIYDQPRHPYTEALLSAIPVADPTRAGTQIVLEGDVPDPINPPPGCPFHPRCRYAQDICRQQVPELRRVGPVEAACHFADELTLVGATNGSAAPESRPAATDNERSI
jgi:oligopeptide/dipeptide ABC transporter ATP-binding protein